MYVSKHLHSVFAKPLNCAMNFCALAKNLDALDKGVIEKGAPIENTSWMIFMRGLYIVNYNT